MLIIFFIVIVTSQLFSHTSPLESNSRRGYSWTEQTLRMVCTTHFATTHLSTHTCKYIHISLPHIYTLRFPFFYMTVACLPWASSRNTRRRTEPRFGPKTTRQAGRERQSLYYCRELRRRTLLVLQSNAKAYHTRWHQLSSRYVGMRWSFHLVFPSRLRPDPHTHSYKIKVEVDMVSS